MAAPELLRKTVLVLSDSDKLARAIEVALKERADVCRIEWGRPGSAGAAMAQRAAHLIVLALSSPSNEPIIALSKAGLTGYVGRTPILIISYEPFNPDLEMQVTHLEFPFTLPGLYHKVDEILALDGAGV